ncbi:MAG TPA: potassium transporter Kup [Longimicrobiales bacterium]|nr:potassium transporter Kup [Longimicrobiales bacterium]
MAQASSETPSNDAPPPHSPGPGERHAPPEKPTGKYLAVLSLAALGVVYGDIGTSPIYALRESLHGSYGVEATRLAVLGVLSLIFWSLILVISIKYLGFVLMADNKGEGGIIALTALVMPRSGPVKGRRSVLVFAGLFGAALLYGDSMITPAISVLSAIEGLEIVTPVLTPYVVPITVVILVALFSLQRRGTARVGALFGPVVLLWFLTLGVLGLRQIIQHPSVFQAINPAFAVAFFADNGLQGFLVLGSVFLVVTGGEALYADMGHFGKRPIRLTWFCIVLPGLLLNYFGQGAMVIEDPATIEQPFFLMAPRWGLIPLVILTTCATVIASQAVISGAFSLTRQAVQLGYLPRVNVHQTSDKEIGQIYIPGINWLLMAASIGLVLGFRTSSNLASAYGVAVTTDMVFTTVLFAFVAYARLGWPKWAAAGIIVAFLGIDLAFWGANLHKIPSGGWFPLVVAAALFVVMTTWRAGRRTLGELMKKRTMPVDHFLRSIERDGPVRVPGLAVYMHGDPDVVPPALLHNLKHNKVLHEQVLLLSVRTHDVPYVPREDRIEVEEIGDGLMRATVHYGFAQDANVPAALALANAADDLAFKPMETTYFLGREHLIADPKPPMNIWRARLFTVLSRNETGATTFFQLPPNRVVEMGSQVEI